jgi:hypothetical protein
VFRHEPFLAPLGFPTELMDIPPRTDILITTTARPVRHEARLFGTFLIDLRAQL